ncbi:glycosyltransferase involved in cell wall biosynthesis [Pararhizobium capsulatum DSM 1112]|uniref:Glycosyltransferase involved in cell wall biosynthesis n=1 Tax=Pararhizobium capsulatum DSM 1112 TaxID=1121113 RepID=A0ABU0BN77_9HYPH|nr:glycosyltransferase family 4 protein [Pararhizobium capsulatum]MDQ0319707.1 glycosyltransferase involved in cell wall biosynthesis [Pararhizobium capsulatum DSM 1112]
MKIDVLMIGFRHVQATQGGIETHVRHLAEELASLGLNVAVAVRKRRRIEPADAAKAHAPYRSMDPSASGTRVDFRLCRIFPDATDGSSDGAMGINTNQGELLSTGEKAAGNKILIIPIWSPRFVAFEAIVHSLLCILYAAIVRPRIVHIHAIGPGIVAPLASVLGLRVVATHHGQDYHREKWGALARFVLHTGEVMQALAANEIICVSKSLSERLTKRYRRSYTYIPNGVNEVGACHASAILDKLALRPGGYILTVGRIVPEKRQGDLIDAFNAAAITDMKLVIVGGGETGSDHVVQIADKATRSLNVIMAGFREGADLEALYANAAAFALPSSHEGLPIVLLEAMAHGCELVVSDIEPHREFAFAEESYHPVGDIHFLADRMRNAVERSASNGSAKDWSAQLHRYRWPAVARQALDVFRLVDHQIGQTHIPNMNEPVRATLPTRLSLSFRSKA